MRLTIKVWLPFTCCLALLSCRHTADLSSFPEVSFQNNVQAIITANCTQSDCHTGQGHLFPLLTYDDIHEYVESGNADNSKLFEAITGRSGKIMPPPPQSVLTEDQIKYIYLWIEQGAKNN